MSVSDCGTPSSQTQRDELATKMWLANERNPMAAFAVILALMWSSNRCNCNL